MFKIKKDTFRKKYEITRNGIPVFTCEVQEFVDLANAITQYVVGKDYVISNPNQTEKAKGFGKYHFIKGFLLAFINDLKKKK